MFAYARPSHRAQSTTRTRMYVTPDRTAERRRCIIYSVSQNIYVDFYFVVIIIAFLVDLRDSSSAQPCRTYKYKNHLISIG